MNSKYFMKAFVLSKGRCKTNYRKNAVLNTDKRPTFTDWFYTKLGTLRRRSSMIIFVFRTYKFSI